ncbi:MAG: septum formation family protein [Nocardioides sp.]
MRHLVAVVLVSLLTLAGCTADDGGDAPTSSDPSPTDSPSSAAPPTASAAPRPANRACYDLSYSDAVAPTTSAEPVGCSRPHTAMTYATGDLDTVVDGHLLAVDSERVQDQVAADCPERFATFVGGSTEDLRLSMLRPVWFTPTVEESDAGASWFRCDVVALATDEELAPLTGRLAGALGTPEGRDRYGMCGTAEPGSRDFTRVVCSQQHSWRAVAVVPFPAGSYPGEQQVRAAGDAPCEDAGAAASSDSLEYAWGYEWPTAEQWKTGQTFGRCWVPD